VTGSRKDRHDDELFDALIERSSLGSAGARQLRERIPRGEAELIRRLASLLDAPEDPRVVARLLDALRKARAVQAVNTLAERAAARVSLDDPYGVAMLLGALREAGAHAAVQALLARDPASQASLDNPEVTAGCGPTAAVTGDDVSSDRQEPKAVRRSATARRPGSASGRRGSPSTEPGAPVDLVVRIRALLPSLTPAEQRVARLAVSDPGRAARWTISEYAERAQTSGTAIIGFCRVIGLDGYPALRIALAATAAGARRLAPGEMLPDAKAVGARLRAVRTRMGLSLHGVEERSRGRWKAVAVGAYERGDRPVTVQKLAELAEFYSVPMSELLPGEPAVGPTNMPSDYAKALGAADPD